MLQLKSICKQYKTGDLVQTALDHVSVTFRDNEFVAVLGPSGSGKTTLLNVVGGLDRYDSGDLVIRGISTKRYHDRDWDSYRNHSVGFVFQSYNLIPHQSILANVELSLTIGGISRRERTERARKALEEVGLLEQLHKKPNQLSGGQMQRVAIARALVNDPDIVLADEPTGALDSETSLQVMELLKNVAKNRLVIMVTHNGELAEQYATRIVRLKDGRITGDSDPVKDAELREEAAAGEPGPSGGKKQRKADRGRQNMGRASMSFATSLHLSFNNLRTKKARTILTAFAGSIGIIGIALILSLSTGVNLYIEKIQKDTMTSYPITITAQSIDLESIMNAGRDRAEAGPDHDMDAIYANTYMFDMASTTMTSISENNLTAFKRYLDDQNSPVHRYVGETGILYSYELSFDVYSRDPEGVLVDTGSMGMYGTNSSGMGSYSGMSAFSGSRMGSFTEMLPGSGSELVSQAVKDSYDLLYGHWPVNYDEVVLVANPNNEISMVRMYQLGLLPRSEYEQKMQSLANGETIDNGGVSFSYEELCGKVFYLIPECDYYAENADGTFSRSGNSALELEALAEKAIELKVSAIVRLKDADDMGTFISGAAGYTKALSDYLMTWTGESAVVQAQKANPETNILTGYTFSAADDETRKEEALDYLKGLSDAEKAQMIRQYIQGASGLSGMIEEGAESGNTGSSQETEEETGDASGNGSASAMLGMLGNMSDARLAAMFDQYLKRSPDDTMLLQVYEAYLGGGSYEGNLRSFGLVDEDTPSSISIYADSFEDKDGITDSIKAYNETVPEEDEIIYTDYVGLLMSSVTTIINVISYVLIAFVSVSLIVSSIMIGIITYISVLERTKEIGILRAIGASKRNISQVFNAETFIIGLLSGLIGVGVTWLLLIPANAVIHGIAESTDVNAVLPIPAAVILVILSLVLTIIAGFIPSKKAARKDPVAALRTE